MTTTYFTFGRRYGLAGNYWGLEPHPSGFPVSRDGWCEITGCDREQARKIAFALLADRWAFDYDETHFDPTAYTAGCQLRVTIDTPQSRKTPKVEFDEAWTIAPWNKPLLPDALRKLGDQVRRDMIAERGYGALVREMRVLQDAMKDTDDGLVKSSMENISYLTHKLAEIFTTADNGEAAS